MSTTKKTWATLTSTGSKDVENHKDQLSLGYHCLFKQ